VVIYKLQLLKLY